MISFTVDKAGRLLVVIPDRKGKLHEYLPVPTSGGYDLCRLDTGAVHMVTLIGENWRCSCRDFICRSKRWSGEPCKHVTAAQVLVALREATKKAEVA